MSIKTPGNEAKFVLFHSISSTYRQEFRDKVRYRHGLNFNIGKSTIYFANSFHFDLFVLCFDTLFNLRKTVKQRSLCLLEVIKTLRVEENVNYELSFLSVINKCQSLVKINIKRGCVGVFFTFWSKFGIGFC